jgi:hypothetical protein
MTNKLATFRIDEDTWNRFQEMAKLGGGNASQELLAFINFRLSGGGKPNTWAEINESISSEDLDARVRSYLDRNLDKCIESYLDNNLDRCIDNSLDRLSPKIGDADRELPQTPTEAEAIEPLADSSKELDTLNTTTFDDEGDTRTYSFKAFHDYLGIPPDTRNRANGDKAIAIAKTQGKGVFTMSGTNYKFTKLGD